MAQDNRCSYRYERQACSHGSPWSVLFRSAVGTALPRVPEERAKKKHFLQDEPKVLAALGANEGVESWRQSRGGGEKKQFLQHEPKALDTSVVNTQLEIELRAETRESLSAAGRLS